ncbi:hypothetical protein [Tunturiibacter lichenicola]|uniref:hypothetical protein n=1 Tax=Tunturiibacter lichenicola TaxID=2051959 RepID=UPI003D9ABDB9
MAFKDDFANCMKPYLIPDGVITNAMDLAARLKPITTAFRAAGGAEGLQLRALLATAALGIDAAALAAAGGEVAGVLATAYIAMYAACAVSAAGVSIWDAIAACNDADVAQAFTIAANNAGVNPVVVANND